MTLRELILLLLSIAASAGGQFFLKSGALKLGQRHSESFIGQIFSIVQIPELVAGLITYGMGAIAYIMLLRSAKLSVAAPAIALVYVFSVILGYFVFREPVPLRRIIGLSLIVFGVLLVVGKD